MTNQTFMRQEVEAIPGVVSNFLDRSGAVLDGPALLAFDDFDGFHDARSLATNSDANPSEARSFRVELEGETPARASVGGAWPGPV